MSAIIEAVLSGVAGPVPGAEVVLRRKPSLPPPSPNGFVEEFSGLDGEPWPVGWMIEAIRGKADIFAGQGRLICDSGGTYTGPVVSATAPFQVEAFDFRLQGTGNFEAVIYPGTVGELRLDVRNGWPYVYRGPTLVIDGRRVGNRPGVAGSGPWFWRFRVEREADRSILSLKRWAPSEPEPELWNYQIIDTDLGLRQASGPFLFRTKYRGSVALFDHIQMASSGEVAPIPYTTDLRVPYDGRDVADILAQRLAEYTPGSVVRFEPNGIYGIEQTSLWAGLDGLTFEMNGAQFVRRGEGVTRPMIEVQDWADLRFVGVLKITGGETTWADSGHTPLEFAAGFKVGFAKRPDATMQVDVLDVQHCGGDGFQGAGGSNLSFGKLISRFNRRQGISFNNGTNLRIGELVVEYAGRSAVDLEPYAPDWQARGIWIGKLTGGPFLNYLIAAVNAQEFEVEDIDVQGGGLGMLICGKEGKPTERIILRRVKYHWQHPEWNRPAGAGGVVTVRAKYAEFKDWDVTSNKSGNHHWYIDSGILKNLVLRGVRPDDDDPVYDGYGLVVESADPAQVLIENVHVYDALGTELSVLLVKTGEAPPPPPPPPPPEPIPADVVRVDFSTLLQPWWGMGGNYINWYDAGDPNFPAPFDRAGQFDLDTLVPRMARVFALLHLWEATEGRRVDNGSVHDTFLVMQEMARRGIRFIASVGVPPLWATTIDSTTSRRKFIPEKVESAINSFVAFLVHAKTVYGVEAEFCSFNESESGISVSLSAAEYADIVARSGPKLVAAGLKTKWLAGDTAGARLLARYAKTILENVAARPYIGGMSFHPYDPPQYLTGATFGGIAYLAQQHGVSVLVGEMSLSSTEWARAIESARRIMLMTHTGRAQAIVAWAHMTQVANFTTRWLPVDPPTLAPKEGYWVQKHLAETLPPGRAVAVAHAVPDVSVFAVRVGAGYAVALLNVGIVERMVSLQGLPAAPQEIIRTTATTRLAKSVGSATLTLPAQSLVTVRG